MKKLILLLPVALAAALMLPFNVGCNRDTPPPTPLTVEELPAAMEKAFSKATPENQALANQIAAAVRAQDYSKAFLIMQNLSGQPGLTREQQIIASRASLSLNELVQAAQAKGDQKAAQTIKSYLKNK